MEKKRQDMIKKANEELIRWIERGGKEGVEAAEELLSREDIDKRELITIIRDLSDSHQEDKVRKLKDGVASKIIERNLLDERVLLYILSEIQSQEILKKAVEKYRTENEKLSDGVLMEIIRKIPNYIEEMGRILLKQTNNPDALLVIVEEAEGVSPKLQGEALKMLWQIGIKLDDASFLTGFVPSAGLIVFEKLRQEGRIEKLSEEDLEEIRLSDHPKISQWATRKLVQKLKEKRKKLLKRKEMNLKEIKHLWQLNDISSIEAKKEENTRIGFELDDIDKKIEKLEVELKRT